MGNPHAHITLGEHHLGGTDPFEDAGVRFGEGLGPDRRDLQVDERSGGQDGCLDVGADGNHRGAHILGADLAQGLQAGGVGLEDVAECAGVVGDEVGVEVDPHDVVTHLLQRDGERRAEAAETDHQHGVGVAQWAEECLVFSQ